MLYSRNRVIQEEEGGGVYFRCYSQSHPGSRSFLNADSPILDLSRWWCAVCGAFDRCSAMLRQFCNLRCETLL